MSTDNNEDQQVQIKLATKLLETVRHAAYATVNEDGTPHNSPLMFIYNEDLTKLYIGSYSDSLHCKNLVRSGRVLAALYDSFTKGQGGVYIMGVNGHECEDGELVEALRVHNNTRAKHGSQPIDISYYQMAKPAQRMYGIDIARIEIYSVIRREDGLIVSEARTPVDATLLVKNMI